MSDKEVKPYTLTVRGVEPLVVQLMRIAAVHLAMTQGDAVTEALLEWITAGRGAAGLNNSAYAKELKVLQRAWFDGR